MPCLGTSRSGLGYFRAEVMMMAEGQGNGNDSPERDSAWQSAPSAGGAPGAPDTGSDPGAADAAPPGASWFPFATTPPASEAEPPPASPQQAPDPQQAPGAQQGSGAPQAPTQQPPSPQP